MRCSPQQGWGEESSTMRAHLKRRLYLMHQHEDHSESELFKYSACFHLFLMHLCIKNARGVWLSSHITERVFCFSVLLKRSDKCASKHCRHF